VLYNDDKNYEECVEFSSRNNQQEAPVDCLMAQAKRDNDSQLCEQFSENHKPFVSICKDNVKRYNKK
jgi:hypothetical protein